MFGELRTEPERFWETDDRVLVFVRLRGLGDGSGAGFARLTLVKRMESG